MTESSDTFEWYIHDGEREIGPLTEIELRKRLKRGRRDKLRVRQNDGPWYPAKEVVRKFRQLAENGIYIKFGTVAGPYTAEKALAILSRLSLNGVKAKVGLHGFWIPAEELLTRLQQATEKTDGRSELDPGDSSADAEEHDSDITVLEPLSTTSDPFGFGEEAPIPVVEPIKDDEPIPTVQPISESDQIPVVEPIAEEPVVVQPVPVVAPVPDKPVEVPLMHWCSCGREVRVLPQHVGMTMQCPACKRTFVAGLRSPRRQQPPIR